MCRAAQSHMHAPSDTKQRRNRFDCQQMKINFRNNSQHAHYFSSSSFFAIYKITNISLLYIVQCRHIVHKATETSVMKYILEPEYNFANVHCVLITSSNTDFMHFPAFHSPFFFCRCPALYSSSISFSSVFCQSMFYIYIALRLHMQLLDPAQAHRGKANGHNKAPI